MICSNCGRTLIPTATYCPGCKTKPQIKATSGKRPPVISSPYESRAKAQNTAGKITLLVLAGAGVFLILLWVGATIVAA